MIDEDEPDCFHGTYRYLAALDKGDVVIAKECQFCEELDLISLRDLDQLTLKKIWDIVNGTAT